MFMWILVAAVAVLLVGCFAWAAYRAVKRPSYWDGRTREEIASIRSAQAASRASFHGAAGTESKINPFGGGGV
ncbi:hypothetical protein [Aeromicrobium yanjiei]|uniref:Uncharacterized protein n=1 Tax=Aeromicrobium yanjiei TaxID=2662028 RepID=A0A5Q2MIV8_9ACTN|nr:hypothetical protein [Aeromicrobium yanjiei]QGG40976.1 hypothetical protein GEV26_06165 [Aeromicrobium yanjiei]